jgi:hypothetical protein
MPRFGLLIATGLLAAGRDRAETLPAAGAGKRLEDGASAGPAARTTGQ